MKVNAMNGTQPVASSLVGRWRWDYADSDQQLRYLPRFNKLLHP